MGKSKKIIVKGIEITIIDQASNDYVSLTDMVKGFEGNGSLIEQWLRNKNTLQFLATWELMNNPNFNSIDFEGIKKEAGLNSFTMSVKRWIEITGSIGVMAKAGRYGGTYAHKDIAYHFGMYLSPEFNLLIIKEFERLKEEEAQRKEIGWDFQRFLCKVNYRIQTDSVKANLIPTSTLPEDKKWLEYAEEADLINLAVFGKTAGDWREENPKLHLEGKNIRDVADLYQLNVVSNLEVINSKMIREGLTRKVRLDELIKESKYQLSSLYNNSSYTIAQIQSPFSESTEDVSYTEIKEEPLSDLNQKLKQGLNWNPKDNKGLNTDGLEDDDTPEKPTGGS